MGFVDEKPRIGKVKINFTRALDLLLIEVYIDDFLNDKTYVERSRFLHVLREAQPTAILPGLPQELIVGWNEDQSVRFGFGFGTARYVMAEHTLYDIRMQLERNAE